MQLERDDSFFGGWSRGPWSWSGGNYGESVVGPMGVAISRIDSAVYVSSDDKAATDRPGTPRPAKADGAIYRIGLAR